MRKRDRTFSTITVMVGIVGVFLRGFVFIYLYEAFLTMPFSLPQLSLPTAIGIMLLISFVAYKPENAPDTEEEQFATVLMGSIIGPLIFMFFGFLVSLFI